MLLNRRSWLGGVAACGLNAAAASETCRDQDELWFVNSRGLGCHEFPDERLDGWTAHRAAPCQAWQPTTLAELLRGTSDGRRTVVYLHGNRIDEHYANRDGRDVHAALARGNGGEPIRFVIWSWRADQVRGPIRDGQTKAQIANGEAYPFARFLTRISTNSPVGVVSFSYGGRIVGGGLHLAAGGTLDGRTLPPGNRPAMRAVLWVPASNTEWFLPGRYHARAIDAVDRMTLMYNPEDPALQRYHVLNRQAHPSALGYVGLARPGRLGDGAARFEQSDVSCQIGRSHDMHRYLASPSILSRTRASAMWES